MKGSKNVLSMCQSVEEQDALFRASALAQQFHSRIAAAGYSDRLKEISRELGASTDVDEVMDALERAAASFDISFISECILEEVRRYTESALYSPVARTVVAGPFAGVVLFEDREIRLTLMSLSPIGHRMKKLSPSGTGDQGVTIQGSDTVIRFLRSGGAVLRVWEVEAFERDDALHGRTLPECVRQNVSNGGVIRLVGGRHGMSIERIEDSSTFVMATNLRPRVAVNAHFREECGVLHSFTASRMASSRIQLLTTMLRELDQGWFDSMVDQLQSDDHFVRWHVMREMLAMDMNGSTPHLLKMASEDPHPQVRDVANEVSGMINGERQCRV